MRLVAVCLAIAAAVAFAIPHVQPVLGQDSGVRSGGSATQEKAGSKERGSGGASIRSESSERSAGSRSERTRTTVGIGTHRNREAIHTRSQVRVGVRGGGSDDVFIKRKRAHRVVGVDNEPSGVVIKKKIKRRFVASEPEGRTTIIKKRQPSVAVRGETSRATVRSRTSGDVNFRANVRSGETARASMRSRETTSRSSTTLNRGQRSSGTTGSGSGQSKGQSGGNMGNRNRSDDAR